MHCMIISIIDDEDHKIKNINIESNIDADDIVDLLNK